MSLSPSQEQSTSSNKMSVSLPLINNRDSRGLLNSVKNARISTFWTPSSFYIQLIDEDEFYNNLEAEMLAYYNGVAVYSYCCKLSGETPENPALNKLKIQFLNSNTKIAVKIANKWVRCVTSLNPRECRNIDTGATIKLTSTMEKTGIYKLATQFLSFPPRAVLCGLNGILPNSPNSSKWTLRACKIVKNLIADWPLRVYFNQTGAWPNTYYVYLTATSETGYNVHINTALCAFDTAVADIEGLFHPIWPSDTPL